MICQYVVECGSVVVEVEGSLRGFGIFVDLTKTAKTTGPRTQVKIGCYDGTRKGRYSWDL